MRKLRHKEISNLAKVVSLLRSRARLQTQAPGLPGRALDHGPVLLPQEFAMVLTESPAQGVTVLLVRYHQAL